MSKFDELVLELCPDGVEFKRLGELGKFFGGLTGKSKDDFTDGNAKFITYKNVYANPALQLDVEDRVKIADGEKQRTLQYGDVIFNLRFLPALKRPAIFRQALCRPYIL